MYGTYILKSLYEEGYYVGNSEHVSVRLIQHNQGRVRSTKSKRPWVIVYQEVFPTKQDAYRRELQIKSYKGGEGFKKLFQ